MQYCGTGQKLRYTCSSAPDARGVCTHSFAGEVLDQLASNQVLLAMQPGALELSLAATQDVIRERASIEKNWQQRIERARIAASVTADRWYNQRAARDSDRHRIREQAFHPRKSRINNDRVVEKGLRPT